MFQVRGSCFPLRSLNLYAPFLSASVTSYGPSHFGPSFLVSSARLASLLRYTKYPGLKLVLRTLELSCEVSSFSFPTVFLFLPNRVPHDGRGLAGSGMFVIAHDEYFRRTQLYSGPTVDTNLLVQNMLRAKRDGSGMIIALGQ
ncbi:hypothetical protein Tco_0621787 [Tanacetum coccineum]